MADIQTGYSFSGTAPNNNVTAPKLNLLVGGATILPAFLGDKTEQTNPASTDMLLILRNNIFYKAEYGNFIPSARGKTGSTALLMFSNTAAQVTITAREILMKSSAGLPYVATSFSNIVNMAASGANGLDTGVEAANTWYYLWAISTGSVDRGLISASSTSPTLPSGYIYSALLGVVRNDNSSNFLRFAQNGYEVSSNLPSLAGVVSANLNPYTNGVEFTDTAVVAANTFQTVDISRCVPPNIVSSVRGLLGHTSATNGTLRGYGVATTSDGTLIAPGLDSAAISPGFSAFQTHVITGTPVIGGFTGVGQFNVPVRVSQQIAWAVNSVTGSIHNMRVTGYSLNL